MSARSFRSLSNFKHKITDWIALLEHFEYFISQFRRLKWSDDHFLLSVASTSSSRQLMHSAQKRRIYEIGGETFNVYVNSPIARTQHLQHISQRRCREVIVIVCEVGKGLSQKYTQPIPESTDRPTERRTDWKFCNAHMRHALHKWAR